MGYNTFAGIASFEVEKESQFFKLENEKGTSVLEVVNSVKKVTGKDFKVAQTDRRPGNPAKMLESSKKALDLLGWKRIYGGIDVITEHARKWHERIEY